MISELGKKILFLIIYSSDFVISSELSRICNASISTIRKEIEILNKYLEDKGCHIDSKTSQGYCLMIDSELKSNDFIKRFLNNYHRLNYTKEFKFSSAYFMIRKLLTSSKTISVDDLASELYVSKSTILRNLSHVREILSPFSLDLKTVRNKGIEIKGDEWNKRLCLILMRRIHILNHSTSYLNESTFESQFMINSGIVRTINHVLRNALQEFPSVKFAGIEMPKICNLILLNSTRNQFASQITFNSTQQNRIFHSLEYELAKVIYHKLPELFHDDYLPQNTMILAAYLIGSRSYTSIQQLDKFDALKYKKVM